MFIIIAGAGIVGRSMTKILSENHDVVVIDPDYDSCEKISTKYGAVAIQGDATKIATLRDAGIEKCDYAIGVMGEDSKNLLFALLSKDHGVNEIFVRMRDPEYRHAYQLAGATNIGHMVAMMVNKFVLDIENPDIRSVAPSAGERRKSALLLSVRPLQSQVCQSRISQAARSFLQTSSSPECSIPKRMSSSCREGRRS